MDSGGQARAALWGIEDVDWSAFEHPFGNAVDVPGHLQGLLAEPGSVEAEQAGIFFTTRFVRRGKVFGNAAIPAIPFLLRLLATPGVSRRGSVMRVLLQVLQLSVSPSPREVEPAVQEACLDAFAQEARTMVRAARLLERSDFAAAMRVLVAGFADSIDAATPRKRVPALVRKALHALRTVDLVDATPQARLDFLAEARDLADYIAEIARELPEEWLPPGSADLMGPASPSDEDEEEDEDDEEEEDDDEDEDEDDRLQHWSDVKAFARRTWTLSEEGEDYVALTMTWSGTPRTQHVEIALYPYDNEDWMVLRSTVCRREQMDAQEALVKNGGQPFALLSVADDVIDLTYTIPIRGLAPERLERLVELIAEDADNMEEIYTGGADEF